MNYFVDYEKLDISQTKYISKGIQIVVINDYNNMFYPVLSLNLQEFTLKTRDEDGKSVGEAFFKTMLSYYNA